MCHKLCGHFALGSELKNTFYEDSGTILYRTGNEWRLLPGVYPDRYMWIDDTKSAIHVGNEMGVYILENRKAVKIGEPKMIESIQMFFCDTHTYEESDVYVPETMRLGNMVFTTSTDGLELNDGLRSGKVYDTVHHPLPIQLEGIQRITMKKVGNRLVMEVEDSHEEVSSLELGSLRNSGPHHIEVEHFVV